MLILVYQAAFLSTKGLTYGNQLRFVFKRFVAYELFGFVASLLLYIPILSWVFYWTNLCGAAFWALHISQAMEKYLKHIEDLGNIEREKEDELQKEEKEVLFQNNIM